jgi:hypothetical protein
LLQDCAEFLALLALQMGKLKKGATPDREMAARIGRNKTKLQNSVVLMICLWIPNWTHSFLER